MIFFCHLHCKPTSKYNLLWLQFWGHILFVRIHKFIRSVSRWKPICRRSRLQTNCIAPYATITTAWHEKGVGMLMLILVPFPNKWGIHCKALHLFTYTFMIFCSATDIQNNLWWNLTMKSHEINIYINPDFKQMVLHTKPGMLYQLGILKASMWHFYPRRMKEELQA